MRILRALLLIVAVIAIGALPAAADMAIKLKDGRVITVPVSPQDIDSVTFTAPHSAASPPAPIATAPATPAAPSAANLPSQTLAMAPLAPDHPSGRVLHVGPGREIKLPSEAAKTAKDGDVIEIDAADYRGDVAVWNANDIVIRGIGGRPRLAADGEAAQGKAIWVTHGNKIRIENVELSGCHVNDGNGAAIRAEGAGLILSKVYIHDNEDGILSSQQRRQRHRHRGFGIRA